MTLSPEARAAAVVRDYFATDLDVINGAEGEKRTIEALIATAIREACNEKLEEAAIWFLALGPLHRLFREQVSTKLRELKDPTP